jgi:DNA mismatch repair protein MutS
MSDLTPMMKQYTEIKNKNKDCILFFRLGDFYEMFGDDAKTASKILQIALTSRGSGEDRKNKLPMCGIPYHAANNYILKLINAGFKVAICEQVEDPKTAKGLVKREIIKIITPGTVLEDAALDKKKNNYIISVFISQKKAGISVIDVSTGEFYAQEEVLRNGNFDRLIDEIEKIGPVEIVIPEYFEEDKSLSKHFTQRLKEGGSRIFVNHYSGWNFQRDAAYEKLKDHFKVMNLEGFGIEHSDEIISSAGALIAYLYETQKTVLLHINRLTIRNTSDCLYIDSVSLRNLEVIEPAVKSSGYPSLCSVLDHTQTPMGGRELKKWFKEPLTDTKRINERHDIIRFFLDFPEMRDAIKDLLSDVSDTERISGKLGSLSANGRDLNALKRALEQCIKLDKIIQAGGKSIIAGRFILMNDALDNVRKLIEKAIVEEPPINIKDGGLIRTEYDAELSRIRDISVNGKDWIASLQDKERKRSGISSLKVGYTSVFGYYIEVTNSNIKNVPADFIRKQTLVNCERFITPELKEYEAMVLGAQEKIKTLEYEVFCRLRDEIGLKIGDIQELSSRVSELDCLISLSIAAVNNNLVRPEITQDDALVIKDGRHPVVESTIGYNEFIPNDCTLDCSENMLMVITGPNMAGKSTFMRQVCLIVIMAQAGSFVPAKYAKIGIVDKIFTRIGAADYLARGQSTFMVEMIETANILNNATPRSLIILDEVGRGTSTFDGVSIAWAITEYIHDHIKAKTLFATHYYELTEIAGLLPGVKNFNIQVKEYGEKIVFMRKIVSGSTDRSYGIHVAQLAGLPEIITKRAKSVLRSLEDAHYSTKEGRPGIGGKGDAPASIQQDLFAAEPENGYALMEEIEKLDINSMTPMDALIKLKELKEKGR